jgi:hypothetical protein
MMSRKVYNQVSEVISGEYRMHLDPEMTVAGAQGYILQGVASQLAWMFSQDNPNFDRDKFMEACFPVNNPE